MDLVGMTGQDDTLGEDAIVVRWKTGAGTDEFQKRTRHGVRTFLGFGALEDQSWNGTPSEGCDEGGYCGATGMEVPLEFVDVIGRMTCLREGGVDDESPRATL